jgi:hypothetical protein
VVALSYNRNSTKSMYEYHVIYWMKNIYVVIAQRSVIHNKTSQIFGNMYCRLILPCLPWFPIFNEVRWRFEFDNMYTIFLRLRLWECLWYCYWSSFSVDESSIWCCFYKPPVISAIDFFLSKNAIRAFCKPRFHQLFNSQ